MSSGLEDASRWLCDCQKMNEMRRYRQVYTCVNLYTGMDSCAFVFVCFLNTRYRHISVHHPSVSHYSNMYPSPKV